MGCVKASPFKGRWLGEAESERFRRQCGFALGFRSSQLPAATSQSASLTAPLERGAKGYAHSPEPPLLRGGGSAKPSRRGSAFRPANRTFRFAAVRRIYRREKIVKFYTGLAFFSCQCYNSLHLDMQEPERSFPGIRRNVDSVRNNGDGPARNIGNVLPAQAKRARRGAPSVKNPTAQPFFDRSNTVFK